MRHDFKRSFYRSTEVSTKKNYARSFCWKGDLSVVFCDKGDHSITNTKHPKRMSPAFDLRAIESTPLYAPKIYGNDVQWKVRLYSDKEKGNVLELEHNGEKQYKVIMGHISKYEVMHDQRIKTGELLGYSGGDPNAGYPVGISTGSHLHIEWQIDGINQDNFFTNSDTQEKQPYKIGATEEQQKFVNYAWEISKSKKFIEMIEGESSSWKIDQRSHKIGSNKSYDYGFCQINKSYHPEVFTDQFFTDYKYQLDICWKYFKGGVRFYGADRNVSDHFDWH